MAIFCASICPRLYGQPELTGSVTGRILDDQGARVNRARIAIAHNDEPPKVVLSGPDGVFSISGLSTGKYFLRVDKGLHFPSEQRRLEIANSTTVKLEDVVLVPVRTITGELRWQDGEPVVGATVQALPYVAGNPRFQNGASLLTQVNDLGEFRVTNLKPGRYVLVASLMARQGVLPPRAAHPVYFPGVRLASAASVIDLRRQSTVSGMNFTLAAERGVTIKGRVTETQDCPAGTEVSVGLSLVGSPVPFLALTRVQVGEAFQFHGIPPGSYLLQTFSHDLSRRFQQIEIGNEAASDVLIAAPDHITVEISVALDGRQGESEGLPIKRTPRIAIRGETSQLGLYGIWSGQADETGHLIRTDVAAGYRYSLTFGQLPEGCYVASVTQNGVVQSSGRFSVIAGADPARIQLRCDGGDVVGQARVEYGDLPSSGFVVLAPKNREDINSFRTVVGELDGSFRLTSVAPGNYDLMMFRKDPEGWFFDPEYLRQYVRASVSLSVAPSSNNQVQVSVIENPDR